MVSVCPVIAVQPEPPHRAFARLNKGPAGGAAMAADAPGTLPVQLVEQPRLQKLKEMFISKFGSAPKFYVRAPGRVNLIGEHIDYCGYAVLPMAIEQDILIAVEPVKTQVVQLANTNSLYLSSFLV